MTKAQRAWHQAHKQQKKEYDRIYREKNLAKKRAAAREWYQKNRRKLIAKAIAQHKRNPEAHQAAALKYAHVHREKIAAKTRAWYRANRAIALERARESGLKKRYGITQAQYLEMLEKQSGRCAICAADVRKKQRPPVDHCHKTGRVREILCYRCNTGLGQFLDSPALMQSAIRYLVKHGATTA